MWGICSDRLVVEPCCDSTSCLVSVCVSFLDKFYQSLKDDNVKFNSADIEKALVKTCKDAKGKENRFVSKVQDQMTDRRDATAAGSRSERWTVGVS